MLTSFGWLLTLSPNQPMLDIVDVDLKKVCSLSSVRIRSVFIFGFCPGSKGICVCTE